MDCLAELPSQCALNVDFKIISQQVRIKDKEETNIYSPALVCLPD
jgi:hypothetical protein